MARLTGIQRIMEVGMIVSCVFAFFLLLAMASFHPADPGWSQAGLQSDVNNWVGPIGAWFADILFFVLGSFAYSLPFCCAFLGWFLFQQTKTLLEIDYLTIGLRLIGVILLVLGATGLLSLNVEDIHNYTSGGMVGDVLSSSLIPYFSLVGTTLLLLCFFCTGFTLLSGVSWVAIVDKIGEWTIRLSRYIYHTPAKFKGSSNLLLTFKKAEPELADIASADNNAWGSESKNSRFDSQNDEAYSTEPVVPQSILDEPPSVKKSPVSISELKKKISLSRNPPKVEPVMTEAPPEPASETELSTGANKEQGPMPSFDLLERADKIKNPITPEELEIVSRLLEAKLADFNIEARVVGVYPGPVITRFEMDLAPGVKVSKITTLSKDLARSMSAISVRVVEVIPGKSVIGLELPNKKRDMVRLSEVISADVFQSSESPLTMVLGADISGKPVVVDLAKMPHLLVAGTTGSGKSVGVNVMILSLL
ncbi:MAG: S-DNA-T family DNA segregation ATPase FtsK/SpoIIIE, partial [Paraglaciecola sp.]